MGKKLAGLFAGPTPEQADASMPAVAAGPAASSDAATKGVDLAKNNEVNAPGGNGKVRIGASGSRKRADVPGLSL